ncbi:MAG TPA: zinc ribbon domain-containing protein, partial [Chloroflexota bacterium]|nr:zinc ribbon domain-containing protein [Chloroflexota bacterium]
ARRRQRARHANWGFAQLRAFIAYKARLRGVPVYLVDPCHTSQACPACGRVDRGNRPDRNRFVCLGCGLAGPADTIAARNIRARAAVMRPNGGDLSAKVSETAPAVAPGTSPFL